MSASALDEIDSPATTIARRDVVARSKALRAIYREWYRLLAEALPRGGGRVLEIGSGAGFFDEVRPDALRSDVGPFPWLSLALDAQALPFADASLAGLVMTNVLHHLPEPGRFLAEAARCVRSGGTLAMIEPWYTPWSGWIYRRFHHEPFLPESPTWSAAPGGPLSGANGALPWILFRRDRERFRREHPEWEVRAIRPLMPLSYLLSGGFSRRRLVPSALVAGCLRLERILDPIARSSAMFAAVRLARV